MRKGRRDVAPFSSFLYPTLLQNDYILTVSKTNLRFIIYELWIISYLCISYLRSTKQIKTILFAFVLAKSYLCSKLQEQE